MYEINNGKDMSHDAKRQVKSQEAKKGKRPRAIASQLGKRLGFQVERLLVFFCFFLFKVASCSQVRLAAPILYPKYVMYPIIRLTCGMRRHTTAILPQWQRLTIDTCNMSITWITL